MTEEESIETFKSWLEYNKKNKNILREADTIIAVQETILNLIQKLQEENLDVKKEVEKKDKIIDLMAEAISAICTDITSIRELFEKSYCEFINSGEDCCWKTDKTCKDCIIQYFKNKYGGN